MIQMEQLNANLWPQSCGKPDLSLRPLYVELRHKQVATPIYVNRLELVINKLLIKKNESFWLLFKLLFKLLFELLFKLLFELLLKL